MKFKIKGKHFEAKIKITNPAIIESYKKDPEQFSKYINARITDGMGDLIQAEGLQSTIVNLYNRFVSDKIVLVTNYISNQN